MKFIQLVLLTVLLSVAAVFSAKLLPPPENAIPDKYVVVLKKELSSLQVSNHMSWVREIITKHLDCSIEHEYSIGNFKGYAGKFSDIVIGRIMNSAAVDYIQQDGIVQMDAPIPVDEVKHEKVHKIHSNKEGHKNNKHKIVGGSDDSVLPVAVGGSDDKVPVAVGGSDDKVPVAVGGSDDKVPVAVGGSDDSVVPVAVGGSDDSIVPVAVGGSDDKVPVAVGGSDDKVPVAVGGSDDSVVPVAVGGSDDSIVPVAVGGSDDKVPVAVGGSDDSVVPVAVGGSDDSIVPVAVGGSDDSVVPVAVGGSDDKVPVAVGGSDDSVVPVAVGGSDDSIVPVAVGGSDDKVPVAVASSEDEEFVKAQEVKSRKSRKLGKNNLVEEQISNLKIQKLNQVLKGHKNNKNKIIGGSDDKVPVAVGGSDDNVPVAVGGSDDSVVPVAVGGSDDKVPVAVGGSDDSVVPVAVGGSDDSVVPVAVGGSDDSIVPVAVGGSDDKVPVAVGGSDDSVVPVAVGGSDDSVVPVAVGGSDDSIFAETQPNPPSWGLDRSDQVSLPLNQNYIYNTLAGSGADIYIIDTGIYTQHSDFGGRARWGNNFVGDGRNEDCNGHGTHVAGTAAGTKYGIAKKANLIAVKVLGCSGSGSFSGIIAGVDWVTKQHQSSAGKKSVANMSLGGSKYDALNQAVEASSAAGVFHAVSAGNDAGNSCNKSPASAPSAMTVGSTTSTDAMSSFSNYGTCNDIFAPGSNIVSSYIGSPTAERSLSGTSMSSPHVTGVAALILAAKGQTAPATLIKRMQDNSSKNKITGVPSGTVNYLLFSEPNL